jgi:NAD(P)-dependent dehydrogenase (short-subunit alcohol dehydrogenase family)
VRYAGVHCKGQRFKLMQLSGKVVVVTGAGSGIGRELALNLSRRRARVAAVDYDRTSLLETATMVSSDGGIISSHVVDVSDQQQVEALTTDVLGVHGCVSGLVNNAGIIHEHRNIEHLPQDQVERVFNVNWWGTYYMTQAFLPLLRIQPEAFISNVSSMGGYMPFPGQVAYGASKAAVKLLTEGLRVELRRDSNINVSVVYPGAVSSGITENSPDIPRDFKDKVRDMSTQKKVGVSSEKAARTIVHGIEREKPRILVGPDSWIIDKLYRLMPVCMASLMSWLMAKVGGSEYEELTDC